MDKTKKKMIEILYYDWCANLTNDTIEETTAYHKAIETLQSMEQVDIINDYGCISQKAGFIAGFNIAIKLLIGDKID